MAAARLDQKRMRDIYVGIMMGLYGDIVLR